MTSWFGFSLNIGFGNGIWNCRGTNNFCMPAIPFIPFMPAIPAMPFMPGFDFMFRNPINTLFNSFFNPFTPMNTGFDVFERTSADSGKAKSDSDTTTETTQERTVATVNENDKEVDNQSTESAKTSDSEVTVTETTETTNSGTTVNETPKTSDSEVTVTETTETTNSETTVNETSETTNSEATVNETPKINETKEITKTKTDNTINNKPEIYTGSLAGYNKEKGERLTKIALKNAKPDSTGYCARYVKDAIEQAGLGKYEQGHAYKLISILGRNKNFKRISNNTELSILPAGCILVYGKGVGGYDPDAGHVEITIGNGNAVSDFVQENIYKKPTAIFIPV